MIDRLNEIIEEFLNFEEFEYRIIEKTFKDSVYNSFWGSVFKEYDELMEEYETWRHIMFENTIEYNDDIEQLNIIEVLDEIISSGKEKPINKINMFFKSKWKKLYHGIKLNNSPITSLEEFKKVQFVHRYEAKRVVVFNKANNLFKDIYDKQPLILDEFEEKFKQKKKQIEEALNWKNNIWEEVVRIIGFYAKNKEDLDDILMVDFDSVIDSIKNILHDVISKDINQEYKSIKLKSISEEIGEYHKLLCEFENAFKELDWLIMAVHEHDPKKYTEAFERLRDLYYKEETLEKRLAILENIKEHNSKWADDIMCRREIHGNTEMPEDIYDAWKWLQLNNQITEIDKKDPNEIQKDIAQLNKDLMKNAKDLAYERAWYEKIRNITSEQIQAIEGWRQTMNKIGKSTGKRAPMLLKKARELMPKCQSAIPVWIMPVNKVVDNFDPKENKFDVIIVDEASQANLLAMPILFLGKKVIIVGDDEQVSPAGIGVSIEEITALTSQYLGNVPNNHLYDEKTSLYDMAKSSGFKPLMLTEHFRCLPEIIQFSNHLSYNGKIKPLRDTSGVTTLPAVTEYRVKNGLRDEFKVNKEEAEHIVALILACIENENYKDKTIGVISLIGEAQAREIERLLQVRMEPKEYQRRKIQCGTPPQFQGDERDIIFLSVVDSPKEDGGPLMMVSEDGRGNMYRKRYNVAVSRAKDQLWVVHSLNVDVDLKPDDIRVKLIKFASNPKSFGYDVKLENTESDFEERVMRDLLNKGYNVTPQWRVGAYRLDMIVEDGNNKIAIECDGEKYHTKENLPNDIKRQAILERLGWRFIRIRGSNYYKNPDKTMEYVCKEIESVGIKPMEVLNGERAVYSDENNELIHKIKMRCLEIKENWNKDFNL
jgi:superfamily I DNA and/or RNA helicase/very-short-patch-repair endonuclease